MLSNIQNIFARSFYKKSFFRNMFANCSWLNRKLNTYFPITKLCVLCVINVLWMCYKRMFDKPPGLLLTKNCDFVKFFKNSWTKTIESIKYLIKVHLIKIRKFLKKKYSDKILVFLKYYFKDLLLYSVIFVRNLFLKTLDY